MSKKTQSDKLSLDSMMDLYSAGNPDVDHEVVSDNPTYKDIPHDAHRYTKKEFIASGGMKKVSKVFDVKSNRYLAMAELLDDAPNAWHEPFVREARLTAMLVHPNIIAVHDLDVNEEGDPYFTMELKIGDSLEDILKARAANESHYLDQCPLRTSLEIFVKICDAIAFAHSNNVLHLDLKPDQIQIGHFGEVQVCDWGLAKITNDPILDEEVSYEERLFNPDLLNNMTQTGRIKGTPGYMAPEQIALDQEKSKATDVFSLGAILYTILTDAHPYEGTLNEIMTATEKGNLISPAERFPEKHIPASLNSVVMKAMAVAPQSRYASVGQLRKDVHQYLKGHSTAAEDAGFFREFQLFYRRNRAICLTSLSALLVLVLVAGGFFWKVDQQRREEISLRQKAEQAAYALKISEQRERKINQRLTRALTEEINAKNRAHDLEIKSNRSVFSLIRHRYFFSDPIGTSEEVINKLNQSIRTTTDDPELKSTLVYTYFIVQRFDKVVELADWASEPDQDLIIHSRKYAKLISADQKTLTPKNLTKLLREIARQKKGREALIEKMVAYDAANRNGTSAPEVTMALIEAWNPMWSDNSNRQIFRYNASTQHLRIGGPHLFSLRSEGQWTSGKSLLRFLSVRRLVFDRSDFADLNDVKELPLRYINIATTLITDPKPLHDFPRLEWITIRRNQFSAEQIRKIPPSIEIQYPDEAQ